MVKLIELWYLNNKPDKIRNIYNVFDDIENEKKTRNLKISDFFIRK